MADRVRAGATLVAVGVVLLANPLYLGFLLPSPTPGDAFRLAGVYHAQLSVLGLLCLASGAHAIRRRDPPSVRTAAAVGFAAVVGFVFLNRLTAGLATAALGQGAHDALGGALVNPIAAPGSEGLFVEFVTASLFVLGVLAATDGPTGGGTPDARASDGGTPGGGATAGRAAHEGVADRVRNRGSREWRRLRGSDRVRVLAAILAVFAVTVLTGSALPGFSGLFLTWFAPDLLGVPLAGLVLTLLPFGLGIGYRRLVYGRSAG